MARNTVTILGVPVDRVTFTEAAETCLAFARGSTQHHVMTPNPEMLVAARGNEEFRRVLSASSLNVPDGAGLLWAAKRMGTPLPERVAGVDLLVELCSHAHELPPVFLLGAAPGIAEAAAETLKMHNHSLNVAGCFAGSPRSEDEAAILEKINASGANVLFVAFGAPAQDVWISRNLPRMKNIKLAMGVGGAFDFLSGKRKRAPRFMRKLGVEWFWRLLIEPTRLGRIVTAVGLFPLLVLLRKRG